MDQFFGKIVNLSYEFFGVFLPGFFMIVFLCLWWWALGPLAPYLTCGFLGQITSGAIVEAARYINSAESIKVELVSIVVASYFAGHFLNLVAHVDIVSVIIKIRIKRKSGEPNPDIEKVRNNIEVQTKGVWWGVALSALIFSKPKRQSYNAELERLFEKLAVKFSDSGTPLKWRQFYPVAKNYLAQNVPHSLVTTYQNKYTLYRSILMAGVILFWMSLGVLLLAKNLTLPSEVVVNWAGMRCLMIGAITVVIGFSKSFLDNWELFGNTVITETYSAVYGPKHESNK